MLPNNYLSYEFRLPRLTLESTKMYKLLTAEHNRPDDGVSHHWRAPLNSLPSSLSLPRNSYHGVTESHIYRVVGYEDPLRPVINIDDDDHVSNPPSTKRAKVDKTTSKTEVAEATKPVTSTPAPAPAPKPTTPTPAPKPTTPVNYTTRYVSLSSPTTNATTTDNTVLPGRILKRLPSLNVPRPIQPPISNCPVVIPPVGRAFEALCGELDEAESQTNSTALITRGPFGLTAFSSRPPPDLTKLDTHFPHYDRQLLDSFYVWLIQPENIVKPLPQLLDALEVGNQKHEQAKNPALAIRSLLGLTADIAAVVTLLTRYDFRLLLEFYAYEMKIENKMGKSSAQLLDELEDGHKRWTNDITAPRHSGVHPGIIYTLEMMLGRYDPVLLADMQEWAKLAMLASAQEGQAQDLGPGKEMEWSNARLVQLLEEEYQRREEMKRAELEKKEAKRRLKDQLEQQDRELAYHRALEDRYFREQFWSKMDTMEVETTGEPRRLSLNAMDLDEPDNPFGAPRSPVEGTVPMDMGPEIDMDDMDMGADSETDERRAREKYMDEAKLKVKDVTKKENYADLFISSRKPKVSGLAEDEKNDFDLDKMKAERRAQQAEEKRREHERLRREQGKTAEQAKAPVGETANQKAARQLEEIRRARKENEERERRNAAETERQGRGRSRAGSASSGSHQRAGSSSRTRAPSTTGRPRRSSTSRTQAPSTPSRKGDEKKLGMENIVDENPMALVLARPKPPTLKLRPATPPNSATGTTAGGDDPFGPAAPKDSAKLDPKGTGSSSFSFAGRNIPTTAENQPVKPMQRFDPNTATRHSNFNPNVSTSNTAAAVPKGNTLNPSFNPNLRGPSRPSQPSHSPGSGAGSASSGRPRAGSGSGSGAGARLGRSRANSGSGSGSPTRVGRKRGNSNPRMGMGMPVVTKETIKKGFEHKNVNLNPMTLPMGQGQSQGWGGFGNLGTSPGAGTNAMDISPGDRTTSMSPEKQRQKPPSVSSRGRVDKSAMSGMGRQKVARAPWLSDVQEVTEEGLYDHIEGEQGKKIKVEVQGQGEKDVIDGSLRIEELGDDDEDFYVDA